MFAIPIDGFGQLVHHFEMEGNGIDSAGTADAELVGSPSFLPGVIGEAVRTDTGSYLAVSNASSFSPGNNSFTVAMNFRLGGFLERSGMPDLGFAPLLTWQDKDFSDGAAFRVQSTDETGDTLSVFLDDGTSRQELAIDTGASLLDEWHHAAYTVDRTTSEVTLYLNGESIGSVALSVGSIDPTRDLLIGQYDFITERNGNPRFVGGENLLIDDVKVFGNSLNASEIRSLVAVPEPSTFALLGISAMGFYYVRRRRKNDSESNTARANSEKE